MLYYLRRYVLTAVWWQFPTGGYLVVCACVCVCDSVVVRWKFLLNYRTICCLLSTLNLSKLGSVMHIFIKYYVRQFLLCTGNVGLLIKIKHY
jgi:hypothetical protein